MKGYIDVFVGDVLYCDGPDDALTDGHVTEVGGRATVVGDDHQLGLLGRTVHLHVQRVVHTTGRRQL